MKRLLSLAPLFVMVALPFVSVEACGPDFAPDVFVRSIRPDQPTEFAAGKLGVLLVTYPRADLMVAFRYLNGGKLSADEQSAYKPSQTFGEYERALEADRAKEKKNGTQFAEPPGPADFWLKARSRYAPPQPDIHAVREYGTIFSAGLMIAGSYENCQADAFHTAIATLESRAKTWGAHSAELSDWIKGQDAVFSNCGGTESWSYPKDKPAIKPTSPAPTLANAPTLLGQDRAYQIAAAEFYRARFVDARKSFRSISNDSTSPWRGVARYLVARTLVREAFLTATNGPDDTMAAFNPDLMKEAQHELESMRGENAPGISPHAVQSLLNLVRFRTEPQARMREISAALAGPNVDPDYAQDLEDLNWYLNGKLSGHPVREDAEDSDFDVKRVENDYRPLTLEQKMPGFEKAYGDFSELRTASPPIDWLVTFQSPCDSAKKHALAEWKRGGKLWWLIAAMAKASASDADADALIEAAGRVPPESPAKLTVNYHRARLLVDSGRFAQAGSEINANRTVIEKTGSGSAENLFTGLHMRTATKLDDALADAPRKILARTSEEQSSLDECLNVMKDPKRKYDCKEDSSPVAFSGDAAAVLNLETPLATLVQATQSAALPPDLRKSVAMMAWVRAVLLKNDAVAAEMLPLLPQKIQQQAAPPGGFHPVMTLLRNPGLRPYLDPGVQRSSSYDFVESYQDNWWCRDWNTPFNEGAPVRSGEDVGFLSPAARASGEKEFAALRALGSADEELGSQVIAWANAHPADPDVPEALYLTLRLIRYGCYHGWGGDAEGEDKDRVASIARKVGAIMRQRYATDPWTKKATPYVWPVEKK